MSDIALGDNRHLIASHLNGGPLYQRLFELIKEGAVVPHVRARASMRGVTRWDHPSIEQLRLLWEERDSVLGRDHFTHNIPREQVLDYARAVQEAIAGQEVWYDHDAAKQRFRETLRILANSETHVKATLDCLAIEVRRQYERILEDPSFTRADVWDVTKTNDELTQMHAFLNNEAQAVQVRARVHAVTTAATPVALIDEELQNELSFARARRSSGAELARNRRPVARLLLNTAVAADRRFGEALAAGNSAELTAPALTLLGLLTLEQLLELRSHARETIFQAVRRFSSTQTAEHFMAQYVPVFRDYLRYCSQRIAQWYPQRFEQYRDERAALLYGPGSTARAIASGAYWASVWSHRGILARRITSDASGGAVLGAGRSAIGHGAETVVAAAVAGAIVGGVRAVAREMRSIAKEMSDAEMVLIWKHPGVRGLRTALPPRWLQLAHAGSPAVDSVVDSRQ